MRKKQMKNLFSIAFKQQVVQRALNRSAGVGLQTIVSENGVGYSTLQKWLKLAKTEQLINNTSESMTSEKTPHDWTNKEKLEMLIRCGSLDEEAINQACREQGIYPHHLEQWQTELSTIGDNKSQTPRLKREIKALQKELNRKEKALAETAALLVLQKKVNHLYSDFEDV
jgi:transposase-like protein